MKNLIIVTVSLLVLSACNVSQVGFKSMTDQELYEYNASVGIRDKVICVEDVRTGSHIRNRSCSKYSNILEGSIGRLDTPSSSVSVTYAQ